MKTPIKALIIEDSEFDAKILVSVLKKGGYAPEFERVEHLDEFRRCLQKTSWDVVLADYNLEGFTAVDALKAFKESQVDIPFLIISGGIGEDIAVAAMKAGAHDYLMKGNLARLVPVVEREMREAGEREAKRRVEDEFKENETRYRLLWETCPDAVVLVDSEATIQFANPAVWDVFGYAPEDLMYQPLINLVPTRLREFYEKPLRNALKGRVDTKAWQHAETVGQKADGTEFSIEFSIGEMVLKDQKLYVGFLRDISRRKEAEQALKETEEQFLVAREIQQRLFPRESPDLDGFDIAGRSKPADATGGDYFDYLSMLQDRTGLVVGDVTGHGVGPAMLMAEARAYLRIVSRNREDMGTILTRTNAALAGDVGSDRFITMLLVGLEPHNNAFVYGNAGHTSGLLISKRGRIRHELGRTGIPLGMVSDFEYAGSETVPFEEGDVLVLMTDGIVETLSDSDEMFGSDRVVDLVRKHLDCTAKEILDRLFAAVSAFAGGNPQEDDLTCVVVKVG